MSNLLYFNGIIPQTINFNGAAVSSVYYNNVFVWGATGGGSGEVQDKTYSNACLTFTSPNSFKLRIYNYPISSELVDGELIEYSSDNGRSWTEYINTGLSGPINYAVAGLVDNEYKLLFRGKNNTDLGAYDQQWRITGSNVKVSGNIETLLDYRVVAKGGHPECEYGCFFSMFREQTAITDASELILPTNILDNGGYISMFSRCSNLVKAPKLPVTTLKSSVYSSMFYNCTSLTTIPELPATTLAQKCYANMFNGCSQIKISETKTEECPNAFCIPSSGVATGYDDTSFTDMFGSSITIKPNTTYYTNVNVGYNDIPIEPYDDIAKNIAREKNALVLTSTESLSLYRDINAYGEKTWDGTLVYSLDCGETWSTIGDNIDVEAPLINGQYIICLRGVGNDIITGSFGGQDFLYEGSIFRGSKIRCVGNIETLLDYQVVAAGGHPGMGFYCFRNLFARVDLIEAPDLPATTLSNGCYMGMFRETSIVKAPKLPAAPKDDWLSQSCYDGMFLGCTKLTEAPDLPATKVSLSCYFCMFSGCSSLTKVPKISATAFEFHACYKMFGECINLTTIPDFSKVERLRSDSYENMFEGCSKIKVSTTVQDDCVNTFVIGNKDTLESGTEYEITQLENMFDNFAPRINTTYYTNVTVI